jgi:hypothetical protein
MKFVLGIVFALFTMVCQAQVPGYMGKRFMLWVDVNPTPALFVQNVNNSVVGARDAGAGSGDGIIAIVGTGTQTDKSNWLAMNVRPQVTAEYLFARRFSVGVSYSQIAVGTVRGYYAGPMPTKESGDQNKYLKDLDVLKGQATGIHLKMYFGGLIAPMGSYQMLSVYLTKTNTYDNKKANAKQFRNDFSYPVLTYSLGRQTMIVKNLLLKTGVEIGWAFVPGNFMFEDRYDWNAQDYSGYSAHQSLFGSYLFNINVGLGYVLF